MNLSYQIKSLWDVAPIKAGDRFLSMLPPWHAYERASSYFMLSRGIEQVYTTVKNLKVMIMFVFTLPFFYVFYVALQHCKCGTHITIASPTCVNRRI